MPNNYSGNVGAANFLQPVPIIQDGEVWQYGDGSSGVFGMIKPLVDRLAYLALYGGRLNVASQTWLGDNIFDASGGTFVLGSHLSLASINCASQVNGSMFVSSSGGFTTDPGATMNIGGPEIHSGPSAWSGWRVLAGADQNDTFNAEQFDILRVPQLTANRTYTLADPPGKVRIRVVWYNHGSDPVGDGSYLLAGVGQPDTAAHNFILTGNGVHILWSSEPAEDGIGFYWADLYWNGTTWMVVGMGFPNIS